MSQWMNRKVLLLNASFEPLGLIGVARAARLVWKRAAEMVELDGDRVLRSPSFSFPAPSVVRLIQYVDVRGRRRQVTRRAAVMARDGYRCQYCGTRGTAFDLTLDHILPRSRGGRTEPENLCAACQACNQRKGDRTPDEARMPLLANPSALSYGIERVALQQAAQSRPEWRKYLFLGDAREGVA